METALSYKCMSAYYSSYKAFIYGRHTSLHRVAAYVNRYWPRLPQTASVSFFQETSCCSPRLFHAIKSANQSVRLKTEMSPRNQLQFMIIIVAVVLVQFSLQDKGSFLGSDDEIEDFGSLKHNLTVQGTFGSGNSTSSQRGSGIYTGSGSGGTVAPLPLCRDCFGHGTNPTSDPRCRIGCRGSGAGTGAGAPVYTQQNSNAFGFGRKEPQVGHTADRASNAKANQQMHSSKKNKKLKFAFVMLTIVGIALVVAIVIIRRKFGCRMRQGRVVSWNDTSSHTARDDEEI